MTNPFKLVIVVLLFFLALTYVRGFSVSGSTTDVQFSGDHRFPYTVTLTNPTSQSIHPSFIANGPFTILQIGTPEESILAAHATKEYQLFLAPTSTLKVGDVYTASLEVATANETKSIPLLLRKQNAPLLDFGNGNDASFNASGLFTASGVVNAGLLVIIVVLIVALVARVRNRVFGGTSQ